MLRDWSCFAAYGVLPLTVEATYSRGEGTHSAEAR
jgi:hypothetical protein